MELSGTVNLTGTTSIDNSATTVTFNAANSKFGAMDLDNGTLSGAGNVTLSGSLAWTGGTLSTTGTTFANGGILIGGTNPTLFLSSGTLINAGRPVGDDSDRPGIPPDG